MYIEPISIHTSTLFSALDPKNNDLFDAINGKPPEPEPIIGISTPETILGMYAILNKLFTGEYHDDEVRAGEELVQDPLIAEIFLQYPNDIIRAQAEEITNPYESNDIKAFEIFEWVARNIEYKLDKDEYDRAEVWQPPVITLRKGTGDCEDAAFLIHSLMLNAGIPWDCIRTYGGEVEFDGVSFGHAWTAYKRESDDEWIVLDSFVYPTLEQIDDRTPMRFYALYTNNYFFMTEKYSIITTDSDRVRFPGAVYTASGDVEGLLFFPTGIIVNTRV
ncbi:MAG: transglutaminase-like cysteine peptidase [Desulfobacteraceae bacterium]|nr:MAG: transglutaminase-like cysteine peptidase [Desulfobacteraceae bacterium]